MAVDKHFRVKNGIKVGTTEVITESAKVVASTIEVANIILPTKISTIENTLSSLSAALGTYEASLITSTLIENLKDTASGYTSATLSSKLATSSYMVASRSSKDAAHLYQNSALQSKNNAELYASAANVAKIATEGYKLDASSEAVAAQSAKSDAELAKTLAEAYKLSASGAASSAVIYGLTASAAASAAKVYETIAYDASLVATDAKSDANVALVLTQGYRDSAQLSDSAAQVLKLSASSFRDSTIQAKLSASAAKVASEAAQVLAENAKSNAELAQVVAENHRDSADNARSDANAAMLTAEGHRDLADSAESAANLAKTLAQGYRDDALQAKNNADNAKSDALAAAASASSSLVTILGKQTSASASLSAILISETSASSTLVEVQLSKASASSALSTTLTYQNDALNASTSARLSASATAVHKASASSTLTEIVNTKTSASSALVATENYKTTALNASSCAQLAASSALVTKASIEGTESEVNQIKTDASSALVTTKNYETTALNASLCSQLAASSALVTKANIQGTKSDVDQIKLDASSSLVTTESYETTALNASLCAALAASSALVSKAGIQGTKSDVDQIKLDASSALVSTQSHQTTALNASLCAALAASSALVTKATIEGIDSDIDQIKLDASSALVSTQSHQTTALNASLCAALAASSALVTKATIEGIDSDIDQIKLDASSALVSTQSHQTTALNASLCAALAASSALVSKAGIQGTKSDVDQIKLDASSALVSTQSHQTTALNASLCAALAASSALVTKATIEGIDSDIDQIKLDASSALVSTQSHQTTALNASLCAALAASSALVSKAGIQGTKSDIDQIKLDASSSLVTTESHETTALNASLCAALAASSALVSKAGIQGTKSDVDQIKLDASSALVTTESYETTALNASLCAALAASSALVSKAGIQGTKSDVDQIKLDASSALVTTESHETTALNASLCAALAASSALVSKAGIQGTKSDIDQIKLDASSSLVTTESHETTALNASLCAALAASSALVSKAGIQGTKSDIDQIKLDASSALVTTESHETTALNASLCAALAASSALVSKAGIQGTKSDVDQIKLNASSALVTTQSYETTALNASLCAALAASSALVTKATIENIDSAIDQIKLDASSALVTTENYRSQALSASNSAANSASNAQVSEATASNFLATITQAKVTASGAAVSAVQSQNTALNAKSTASGAATAAQELKGSASATLVSILQTEASASASLSLTQNYESTALNSANSASSNAAASLVSKEIAETSASEIGALTSQIDDVRLLDARVSNGLNGHYAGNHWYLDNIGTGCSDLSAQVSALADGSSIVLEEVAGQDLITNGDFSDGTATGWTEIGGDTADEIVVSNGELDIRLLGQGGTANQAGVYQAITVSENTNYDIFIDVKNLEGQTFILIGSAVGAYDRLLATNDTNFWAQGIGEQLLEQDNQKFTFNSGAYTTVYVALFLSGADNTGINSTFDNIKVIAPPVVETLVNSSKEGENYPVAGLSTQSGEGCWKLYSASPIIAKQPDGRMAVPANFSSDILGATRFGSDTAPFTATLFSPFSNATVQVYAQAFDGGGPVFNHRVIEGVYPISQTFTIPKGEKYDWSVSSLTGVFDDSKDYTKILFRSNTNIFGFTKEGNEHQTLLVPLSNSELLGTDKTSGLVYKFVTGGGINTQALERAILEFNTSLNAQAPNLYSVLNSNYGSYAMADITKNGSVNSADADKIQDWASNTPGLSETDIDRIQVLISELDENYNTLETSFSSAGTVYTLYDQEPFIVSNGSSFSSTTVAGAFYSKSKSTRAYHAFSSTTGDGSTTGRELALPRQALSDYYIFPSKTLTHYRLTSVEPNTIIISDSEGRVLSTKDLRLASKSNPLSASSETNAAGTGIDLGSGKGPYSFVGTNPFYLVCQNTDDNEVTMLGALQGVVNGQISQTAVATQISQVSSTVDTLNTTVTQTSESINGLEGQYTIKINNNGYSSGFGLASSTAETVPTSAFVIQADRFALVDPSYNQPFSNSISSQHIPFEIVGGKVFIKSAAVKSLSAGNIAARTISARNLVANTITSSEIAANSITAGELASLSVTSDSIAANTITSSMISSGAVKARELFEVSSESINYDPTFKDIGDSLEFVAWGQDNDPDFANVDTSASSMFEKDTGPGQTGAGTGFYIRLHPVSNTTNDHPSVIYQGKPFEFDPRMAYELSYYSKAVQSSSLDANNCYMAVGIAYFDASGERIQGSGAFNQYIYHEGEKGVFKEDRISVNLSTGITSFQFGQFGAKYTNPYKHPNNAVLMAPVIALNVDANGNPQSARDVQSYYTTYRVADVRINRIANEVSIMDEAIGRQHLSRHFDDALVMTQVNSPSYNASGLQTDYKYPPPNFQGNSFNSSADGYMWLTKQQAGPYDGEARARYWWPEGYDSNDKYHVSYLHVNGMKIRWRLANTALDVQRRLSLKVIFFDNVKPYGTDDIHEEFLSTHPASAENYENLQGYINDYKYREVTLFEGTPNETRGSQEYPPIQHIFRDIMYEIPYPTTSTYENSANGMFWAVILEWENMRAGDLLEVSNVGSHRVINHFNYYAQA